MSLTDHLPECDRYALVPRAGWVCICAQLRQAEQRVRNYLLADDTHSYTYGYRDGVQAAREAVAALHRYEHLGFDVEGESVEGCSACGEFDWPCSTLAAIDALAGEQ